VTATAEPWRSWAALTTWRKWRSAWPGDARSLPRDARTGAGEGKLSHDRHGPAQHDGPAPQARRPAGAGRPRHLAGPARSRPDQPKANPRTRIHPKATADTLSGTSVEEERRRRCRAPSKPDAIPVHGAGLTVGQLPTTQTDCWTPATSGHETRHLRGGGTLAKWLTISETSAAIDVSRT
jgi:hypothetical protein